MPTSSDLFPPMHLQETDNDYYLVDEDYDENDWEPILESDCCCSISLSTDSNESDETLSIDEPECENNIKLKSLDPPALPTVSSRSVKLFLLILSIPLLLAMISASFPTADFQDGLDTLYVPGLGFSGFWFTLGRLKSIPDKASKHYVCFSAGCLGSVAILNDFSVEEMACMAETAQQRWKRGEIDRFQVVTQFVDGLVYRDFDGCLASNKNNKQSRKKNIIPINNPNLFSKLHVLTTAPTMGRAEAVMRSPTSLDELREMLIQTAWIPIATGDGLTHKGHMDGGFSFWKHPRCTKSVNLPLEAGLIFNSLNINMPVEKAYQLWNQGMEYGL
ncbi:expressed unknown protein [Seminavis robusta]|uniref:Uncharacterized protein n=1 Tax=Seminavis robusta TaxID=568900 RepID=A0A9N8HFW9_9STRA|nr:expressed unknown protein [Seminavis robusta]|eukprot:Sro479_g151190.1 n/a (332) ;mRNA; r:24535-25629